MGILTKIKIYQNYTGIQLIDTVLLGGFLTQEQGCNDISERHFTCKYIGVMPIPTFSQIIIYTDNHLHR